MSEPLASLLRMLPYANYCALRHVLWLLDAVAQRQAANKMTHQSLASIFGPVLLRDYGLQTLSALRQPSPKHQLIQEVLDTYPLLPFVLLGDSGQHDPEIYAEIVHNNPGRILAVYIRDVNEGRDADRRAEVETLAADLAALGVDMLLSHDTADFAVHAAAKGLIARAGEIV